MVWKIVIVEVALSHDQRHVWIGAELVDVAVRRQTFVDIWRPYVAPGPRSSAPSVRMTSTATSRTQWTRPLSPSSPLSPPWTALHPPPANSPWNPPVSRHFQLPPNRVAVTFFSGELNAELLGASHLLWLGPRGSLGPQRTFTPLGGCSIALTVFPPELGSLVASSVHTVSSQVTYLGSFAVVRWCCRKP